MSNGAAANASSVINSVQTNTAGVNEEPVSLSSVAPASSNMDYPLPPASELPSYTEALRLKKLEANDIPPGYFNSTSMPPEARITIDAADVSFKTLDGDILIELNDFFLIL